MGLEVHFVRLLHMALFEKSSIIQEPIDFTKLEKKIGYDDIFLLFIIFPMFFAAMHFYLAPIKQRYTHSLQLVVCPILFLPIFYF